MRLTKCKAAVLALLLALAAGLCPALAVADDGAGGQSPDPEEAQQLWAQDAGITELTAGGDAISIEGDTQFAFSPTQTRAYEIAFSGTGDHGGSSMRVYFYEKNATGPDVDYDGDYEEWKRLDYDDLGEVEGFYYAFYGEAGVTYRFEVDTFSEDFKAVSARIVESDKAGVTGGLRWRADRMRDYALDDASLFDGVTIIGYDGSQIGDDLVVPSKLGGYPVKVIDSYALMGLPARSVTFSEGIQTFENYVMQGAQNLERVSLPSTLSSVYNNPFQLHSGIEVSFPNGSDYLKVENDCLISGGVYEKLSDSNVLLSYIGPASTTELTVPDGVATIEWYALEGSGIRKLYCPLSVEHVGRQDDEHLRELHLANAYCDFDELTMRPIGGDYGAFVYAEGSCVYAPAGGTAEQRCKEYGLAFQAEGVMRSVWEAGVFAGSNEEREDTTSAIRNGYMPRAVFGEAKKCMRDPADGTYKASFEVPLAGEYWIVACDEWGDLLALDVSAVHASGSGAAARVQADYGNAFALEANVTYTIESTLPVDTSPIVRMLVCCAAGSYSNPDGQESGNGQESGSGQEESKPDPTPATTSSERGGKVGKTYKVSGNAYKVTSNSKNTVTFALAKKATKVKEVVVPATVKINGKAYKVTVVGSAAFKSAKKNLSSVVVGKNVAKIAKGAFKDCPKLKTVVVKSKKLTKKNVKGSLAGSKANTVKVKVGSKKVNKEYVKKYKKIFTKKNCGRKVAVKA